MNSIYYKAPLKDKPHIIKVGGKWYVSVYDHRKPDHEKNKERWVDARLQVMVWNQQIK